MLQLIIRIQGEIIHVQNTIALYVKFFIWLQKLPQINREFAAKLREQEKEESKRGIKKVSKFNW